MKRFYALCLALMFGLPASAAVQTLQVTIGASATQISTSNLYCRWVVFQDNTAADTMRVGDSTVSSTKGIQLQAGGSWQPPAKYSPEAINLANWYVAGTQNDKIDVVCDAVSF